MKNVLLATTALVASAGIAAAQDNPNITITGFAEFGVFDPGDDDGDELQFHTDIDATFTMTLETDSGLAFGADIDIDETDTDRTISGTAVNRAGGDTTGVDVDDDGFISPEELQNFLAEDTFAADDIEVGGSPAFDNDTQGGESIFVTGPFGTLTMGDTDGAFDFALTEAIIGSAINDDHEHNGYNGNAGLDGTYDGQVARYQYAFGDFAVAVSGEIDDDDGGDPVVGIGGTYSTAFGQFRGQPITVGFGAAYQTVNDIDIDFDDDDETDLDEADIYGVSADIDLAGVQVVLNYSDGDNSTGAFEHFGVAVGYSFDALTVAANYGRFDFGDEENDEIDNDGDGYGIILNYDLGTGAEAQFGYGSSDGVNSVGEDANNDQYSLGIAISF